MNAVAPRGHARLGGSAAGIFLRCTAAPGQWPVGGGRKGSSYAAEGTVAHQLAEEWLAHGTPSPAGTEMTVDGHKITVTAAMLDDVERYVRAVEDVARNAAWYEIEQPVRLDQLWLDMGEMAPEPLFGTADFIAVADGVLFVHDLKFGIGVLVSAKGNLQLRYYALGAFLWLMANQPDLAATVRRVEMAIHQPRAGGTSTDEIDLLDLLEWGQYELKAKVDAIHAGDVEFVPGDHCRFCPAAANCKALHKNSVALAQQRFPEELDDEIDASTLLPTPDLLTDAQIGEALRRAELLNIWLNAVRREAQTRIAKGHPVAGWKLVDRKGYRQFRDAITVTSILQANGLPASLAFSAPELLSPAQVEKAVKRHKISATILAPAIYTPSVGLTLVPAADPRPAVDVSPGTVFPDEDEDDAP